jgi:hypothetical protein
MIIAVSNHARLLPKNKAAKAEYDRLTASLCWVRMDNIRCENDSAAPAGHNETRVLSLISFAIFENAMVKILGENFAVGHADTATLREVINRLDAASLNRLQGDLEKGQVDEVGAFRPGPSQG